MSETDGLIFAWRLDGKGGGEPLDWDGIRAHVPDTETLWVHLDLTQAKAGKWLAKESGLDPHVIDALSAEDTRPRFFEHGAGALVILRGVNLNPGADPDDMVSIRLWAEPNRIVTLRRHKVMAVNDIHDALASGNGPVSAAGFLCRLADGLTKRIAPVIEDLEDGIDSLEDETVQGATAEAAAQLMPLRRQIIAFRRYLSPQRDALGRLQGAPFDWLAPQNRSRLRETADRVYRMVEDLDALRERAVIIQDERRTRISERMNRAMYLLSIVATILLPLGLVAGLLGMNVGGIPGEKISWAFAAIAGGMAAVAAAMLAFFRWIRWL